MRLTGRVTVRSGDDRVVARLRTPNESVARLHHTATYFALSPLNASTANNPNITTPTPHLQQQQQHSEIRKIRFRLGKCQFSLWISAPFHPTHPHPTPPRQVPESAERETSHRHLIPATGKIMEHTEEEEEEEEKAAIDFRNWNQFQRNISTDLTTAQTGTK